MSIARPVAGYQHSIEARRHGAPTENMTAECERFFAEASDYEGLKAGIRARIEQLNIARNCLDEVAGLPIGYAGRLLAPYAKKKIGEMSLGLLIKAAGLRMVLVDDPTAGKRGRNVSPAALGSLLKAAGLKMVLIDDGAALAKVQPMFKARVSHQVRLNNGSRKNKGISKAPALAKSDTQQIGCDAKATAA